MFTVNEEASIFPSFMYFNILLLFVIRSPTPALAGGRHKKGLRCTVGYSARLILCLSARHIRRQNAGVVMHTIVWDTALQCSFAFVRAANRTLGYSNALSLTVCYLLSPQANIYFMR